jgi:hypothetical protein
MTRSGADTFFFLHHRHCLQPIKEFKIELVLLLFPWSKLIPVDGSSAGCATLLPVFIGGFDQCLFWQKLRGELVKGPKKMK